MHKIDYANHSKLDHDTSTRKISTLYSQTSSGDTSTQWVISNQPSLSTYTERINKQYFLKCDGTNKERMISSIDLNANIVLKSMGYISII